jgi:hypothetical protein
MAERLLPVKRRLRLLQLLMLRLKLELRAL